MIGCKPHWHFELVFPHLNAGTWGLWQGSTGPNPNQNKKEKNRITRTFRFVKHSHYPLGEASVGISYIVTRHCNILCYTLVALDLMLYCTLRNMLKIRWMP